MKPRLLALALSAAAGLVAQAAHAQAPAGFPAKVVRIIVPFPAGGTADSIPRIVAEKLNAKWGQPVIVENRPGAGGNIGAELVARAEPDGYTLLASPPGPLTINQSLYKKLSYDPTKFVPISLVATMPNVLAVRPTLGVSSVPELIALAKKTPGKLTYASQGNGTTSHLTANMFESMTDTQLVHVPYKGTAPALTDLMGGQVDLMFDNITSSLAPYKSGRIKILAVAAGARIPDLPDVPTLAEAGVKGFQAGSWVGVVAPANTPAPIVAAISQAIAEAVKTADVQKKFSDIAAQPVGNTPAEMAAYLAAESAKWQRVIRSANVTVD
jgi:tripartite-type tricarboxylate transporter receptor subunit TctC